MKRVLWFFLFVALFAWFGKDGQAQNPGPCGTLTNSPTAGQALTATNTGNSAICTWITGGGGGGGVSNFTAGNLAPIFTTSVATSTTTPALSFAIAAIAAHTVLGNNTAGSASIAAVRLACADLSDSATGCTNVAPANTLATTHQFFSAYNSATGAFTKVQPACGDLSDFGAACSSAATMTINGTTCTLGASCTPPGTGTVTVVASGTLTSTAIVAGGGLQTLQTPSATATLDTSGNISTPGGLSTGVGGSVAGYEAFGQGTATVAPTSSVGFMAPASVTTKFMMTLPAGPTTGFFLNTGTSDPSTISFVGSTGTGNVVRATSPALVTPDLGTPSAATLTNATGLPISTGVSGLGTGVATFLATPTSANLAAALTNETGSGAAVFATSPALVTPDLGVPSAIDLSNATKIPLTLTTTGTSGASTYSQATNTLNVPNYSTSSLTCDPFNPTNFCLLEEFPPTNITSDQIGTHAWETLTTGGSVARVEAQANHFGLFDLRTSTSSSNRVAVYLGNNSQGANIMFRLDNITNWTHIFYVQVGTGTSNMAARVCLVDVSTNSQNATTGCSVQSVKVEYDPSVSNNWTFNLCSASCLTALDSGVAANNTANWYAIRIRSTIAGTVAFSVSTNGGAYPADKTICPSSCTATGTMTTNKLSPSFFITTSDGVDKRMTIDRYETYITGLTR